MRTYKIFTDGACDLAEEWCIEHQVTIIPIYYSLSSAVPVPFPNRKTFRFDDFYEMLRQGTPVRTSAPSLEDCKDFMRPVLEKGEDILYTGLSSRLSGAFNAVRLASLDLKEEFPEREIAVLDSGCASHGLGLLLKQLAEKREKGASFDEICQFCTEARQHIRHFFTVSDLLYLKRGGRISGTTAVMGTVLQIMPIMQMIPAGAIENIAKVRGRKNALRSIADMTGENAKPDTPVIVGHCSTPEDAVFVRDILRRKYNIHDVQIQSLGPIIGAHGGPSAVACFCITE